MPASYENSNGSERVQERLKATLSRANGANKLDDRLQADSKKILLQKIEFKPAEKPHTLEMDSLKSKYIPVNASRPVLKTAGENSTVPKKEVTPMKDTDGESLPDPKQILFRTERLKMDWHRAQGIGAGLVNLGNTCFINATLQCLTYTPPLANYCLTDDHSTNCKKAGFCMMCELQRHVRRALLNASGSIRPQVILQKLKLIAKHLQWGHQEDAHEFLRYVIDGCQKSLLTGYMNLDKYSKETTVISAIFGGFLRSQVTCLQCHAKSNTYDPNLDISLDIKNCGSLQKALEKFVQPELLDIDNAYKCTKCRQKVTAQKRFTVHKAPNCLTIQLKRFEFGRLTGGKVTKHIHFPDRLDVRPYMSVAKGPPMMYKLFSVLVHSGGGCNMGHYYSYVKAPGEIWYLMNDSSVSSVGLERVHQAEAYLLFYIREPRKSLPMVNSKMRPEGKSALGNSKAVPATTQSRFIGPVIPKSSVPFSSHNKVNGIAASTPSNDVGTPVSSKATRLPEKHDKVSFGLQTPKVVSPFKQQESNSKPRIVMKIKHGKVTTIETSPDGQSRIVSDDESYVRNDRPYDKGSSRASKRTSLVPYGDDSDSSVTSQPVPKSPKVSSKMNGAKDAEVKFDQRLNATTSVPGNAHLLETAAFKERMAHSALNLMSDRKIRDMKSPPPRAGATTPVKRSISDTGAITCITSPVTTKCMSGSKWQVMNQDGAPSPSIGSSSSNHSNCSTTEWSITRTPDLHQHSSIPDRQCAGWTVTPGKKGTDPLPVKVEGSASVKTGRSATDLKQSLFKLADQGVEDDKYCSLNGEVDVSDKLPLLGDEDSDSCSHHKKKKKHKKHKKERHGDEYEYERLDREEGHSSRKHKKKKKRKEREREREEERGHGHKRKSEDVVAEDRFHKRHRESSESSSSVEFEWVEKTKDVISEGCEPKSSKSAPDVPTQSWDHHVRDGYKRPAENAASAKATWDGLKGSRVVQELEKMSCLHGYGSSVSAWDGGQSQLDVDADKDRAKKRHWEDDYEEDLDRGKVKKVKKHFSDMDVSVGTGNPFQLEQERKNKEKIRWDKITVLEGKNHTTQNGFHHTSSHNAHAIRH